MSYAEKFEFLVPANMSGLQHEAFVVGKAADAEIAELRELLIEALPCLDAWNGGSIRIADIMALAARIRAKLESTNGS